jgi:uncharacterized protein YbjT (DUF2867 family)
MMTSSQQLPVAVIGATGQQGSSVVDTLLEADVPVRALVRNPDSSASRALRDRGVELVKADQDVDESLAQGLVDVAALFFMTTFEGPDGPDGEIRRGTAVANAAASARVPRVVYSSVGGAERGTGIPHFESKHRVEQRVSDLLPAKFVRPTFFMENLMQQLVPGPDGEIVIRMPMPGDVPLQMIAVRDIGRAAGRLLLDPTAIESDSVEIAGDELTLEQVAERAGDALDRPARFEQIPLDFLGGDEDLKAMFRWFAVPPAYRADLENSRSLVPGIRDVRAWLGTQFREGDLARSAGGQSV